MNMVCKTWNMFCTHICNTLYQYCPSHSARIPEVILEQSWFRKIILQKLLALLALTFHCPTCECFYYLLLLEDCNLYYFWTYDTTSIMPQLHCLLLRLQFLFVWNTCLSSLSYVPAMARRRGNGIIHIQV